MVAIEGLTHGYGSDALFEDATLTIEKGHRVAIIGPNGVGKSTLLRLVMGLEKPSGGGRAKITAGNAVANYFEQNQVRIECGTPIYLSAREKIVCMLAMWIGELTDNVCSCMIPRE